MRVFLDYLLIVVICLSFLVAVLLSLPSPAPKPAAVDYQARTLEEMRKQTACLDRIADAVEKANRR